MNLSMENLALVAAILAGIIVLNIGALVSAYNSIITRLTRLEAKADTSARDVDNLARLIGTERSRNQREETET